MKRNLPGGQEYLEALKETTSEVKNLRLTLNFKQSVLPPPLEDWLGKLSLLYGVPFEHLVPNAGMLPIESLRFFYVDPNWTSCLIDGALSIGSHSSRDMAVIQSVYRQLHHSVEASMQMVRRRLAQAELPQQVNTQPAVSGLLIRSQLISGWPGLEIVAYENYTVEGSGDTKRIIPADKIENLRIERLAPDVMLCLYAKMPKVVQLNEPKEGLSFGALSDGKISPRWMGYHDDQPVGQYISGSITPENEVDVAKRDGGRNVVDIITTKTNLVTYLQKKNALSPSGDLSPADLAIQFMKSAEQQSFISGNENEPNQHDCTDF